MDRDGVGSYHYHEGHCHDDDGTGATGAGTAISAATGGDGRIGVKEVMGLQ